jgi:hypothetical protein
LTMLLLTVTIHIASSSPFFCVTKYMSSSITSPPVTLQNITNSITYTNNTSAKVTVSDDTTNIDVLQILNQTYSDRQLTLIKHVDNNISRLTNCTIWFSHTGTVSLQIKITDGQYVQTSGSNYSLFCDGADRIAITAATNATGTSYIQTHLKILEPNTSTYTLYVITFEII